MTHQTILYCDRLSKTFTDGATPVPVLHDINFALHAKESIAIMGASGSGKSTLLQLLGGLDKPTQGETYLLEHKLSTLNDHKLSALRNRYLGFVYQFHHLLPEFTVIENVCIPLMICKTPIEEAREKAKNILTHVGLGHRMEHKIGAISGGERQRTAIARALVNEPHCLLADEPTGNLDQHTAHYVFDLLLDLNKNLGTSMIIVTHDLSLAKRLDRMLELNNGKLI